MNLAIKKDTSEARLIIKLEDINNSGRGPLFIENRQRLASATSVKFIDRNMLVCCSYVGRKIYVVKFNDDLTSYEIMDSADTIFDGQTTETDLCDTDSHGTIATSNFYLGTATLYRCENNKISHVRDLPLGIDGFVHGIKFLNPEVLALSVTKGPTGLHFFDTKTCKPLLHIKTDLVAKDLCFISNSQLAMLTTHGSPTKQAGEAYHADLHLIDFNVQEKTFEITLTVTHQNSHFDCIVLDNGQFYLTDQFHDLVRVVDSATLKETGVIGGYDFPHGIDINYGMIAVTNYGSNCIDLRRL
jgi:hypothetical protein